MSPGPAAVGAPGGLGALPAQPWGQNGRGLLWGLLIAGRAPLCACSPATSVHGREVEKRWRLTPSPVHS